MRLEAAKALNTAEVRPVGLAESPNLNPNFNSPQWARLERDKLFPLSAKSGLESVVMLAINPVKKDSIIVKSFTETNPKIDDVKKELSYNPSKKSRQYIDHMGRHIIFRRARRGSRCLAQPDHEPKDCQGRRHLKKSKSDTAEALETKPLKTNQKNLKRNLNEKM